MTGVHCELFPGCMELSENAQIPVCFRAKCPGRAGHEFATAFARAVTSAPQAMTDEKNTIADMQAYLWAAGVCLTEIKPIYPHRYL